MSYNDDFDKKERRIFETVCEICNIKHCFMDEANNDNPLDCSILSKIHNLLKLK